MTFAIRVPRVRGLEVFSDLTAQIREVEGEQRGRQNRRRPHRFELETPNEGIDVLVDGRTVGNLRDLIILVVVEEGRQVGLNAPIDDRVLRTHFVGVHKLRSEGVRNALKSGLLGVHSWVETARAIATRPTEVGQRFVGKGQLGCIIDHKSAGEGVPSLLGRRSLEHTCHIVRRDLLSGKVAALITILIGEAILRPREIGYVRETRAHRGKTRTARTDTGKVSTAERKRTCVRAQFLGLTERVGVDEAELVRRCSDSCASG